MERHFHERLADLKNRLVRMSTLAETMIADAVKVLVERDGSTAAEIRRMEDEVNRMQVEVDETCFTLIALQQPAATDLRFILGAIKSNSDLERLADEAINVLNKAERLLREPPLTQLDIVPRMAAIARGMLKDSLDAFIALDTAKAREVLRRDDEVDQLKAEVTEKLLGLIAADPAALERAMALILVARNVERIADHATNIAENAIFVGEGRDVRHHLGQ
jgi:phosphate transport system protein